MSFFGAGGGAGCAIFDELGSNGFGAEGISTGSAIATGDGAGDGTGAGAGDATGVGTGSGIGFSCLSSVKDGGVFVHLPTAATGSFVTSATGSALAVISGLLIPDE
jgi:hypothetical protein